MNKLIKYIGYAMFCSATLLVVSHYFRGLNWQPLVFLWLACLPLLIKVREY